MVATWIKRQLVDTDEDGEKNELEGGGSDSDELGGLRRTRPFGKSAGRAARASQSTLDEHWELIDVDR